MTTQTTATATTARAATHKGHCQSCGWLQKLPTGILAKHGYHVTAGFFSGTCAGSGHRPFEVSFDLLPGFIAAAETHLAAIVRRQAALRTPPTVERGWVSNYERDPSSRRGACVHVWREVDILSETRSVTDSDGVHTWLRFSYRAPGTRGTEDQTHRIEPGYGPDAPTTALGVAAKLNADRAAAMEHEAKSLRRYIAWQQDRIATWQPAPLVPVSVKRDQAGFDPDAR